MILYGNLSIIIILIILKSVYKILGDYTIFKTKKFVTGGKKGEQGKHIKMYIEEFFRTNFRWESYDQM